MSGLYDLLGQDQASNHRSSDRKSNTLSTTPPCLLNTLFHRYGSHTDFGPGHPIMIIEINIFLCEQLISMFIMGCPGREINMAAVSAKRSNF